MTLEQVCSGLEKFLEDCLRFKLQKISKDIVGVKLVKLVTVTLAKAQTT